MMHAYDDVDGMPCVANGSLERKEERILQLARADVRRRVVEAALRQPVADHVLASCEDSLLGRAITLESADVGRAQLRDQVGILAVCLLDPAPARIAGDIEDGGESLLGARGAKLTPKTGGHGLDQLGLPRGCPS